MALALPVSILIHLLWLVVTRPTYRPVADFAVDLDVIEVDPAPPSGRSVELVEKPVVPPPPDPPPAPEPKKKRPKVKPTVDRLAVVDKLKRRQGPATEPDGGIVDASVADLDAAVAVGDHTGTDGDGDGTGICLHDLFAFAPAEPTWLMWISLASFNQTSFQSEVFRTLRSFELGRRLSRSLDIDSISELQGVLVTAEDVLKWRTFAVTTSHLLGEERIKATLSRPATEGSAPPRWVKTADGFSSVQSDSLRWHLAGSGRVMIAEGVREGIPVPAVDAGVIAGDAGAPAPLRRWPRQVSCLSAPKEVVAAADPDGGPDLANRGLGAVLRRFLRPDDQGHWPVAALATSDHRAVGLSARQAAGLPAFEVALIRAYFSDPIRLEGRVRFAGDPTRVAALAAMWRRLAAAAARDPFMSMAGFGNLFARLKISVHNGEIRLVLPMTQGQVKAALVFFQLQGEAMERRMRRSGGSSTPP